MLVILLFLSGAVSASGQNAGGAAAVRAELSKLPLSFIPNQGQADPAVLYQAKAEGHTIFFTSNNVVLVTDNNGAPVAFSTTVAGANPTAAVIGVDPLPGTANFFIGNDPLTWRSGLATYGGVEYHNILPGVDLTYRGNNGVLKREFVVAPGADASGIVITYDNIDGLAYGPGGTLQVQTPSGVLTETAPVCYQVINGKNVDVPAQYNILTDSRVSFSFGAYDTAYPLVIDPALLYSSYLGGTKNDGAMGVAVDSLGQAYVTGYTESNNFPINWTNTTLKGCSDVFVTKVSANGKSLLYSTYLGGNNSDVGNGIAIDIVGRAFVTGYTTSINYPIMNGTPKNHETTGPYPCAFPGCLGQADAFLSILSPDGRTLPVSTCFGGNYTDVGTSIAVSPNGSRVYLTGFTNSNNTTDGWADPNNFPLSADAYQKLLNQKSSPTTTSDAFIIGYDLFGTTRPPSYSSYFGGSNNDQGLGITSSNGSNPTSTYYVTGWTQSPNFPTLNAPSSYKGEKDGFVSRFTDPNALYYSTYLGGEGNDECHGVAVANISGDEYAYVTGVTYSNYFPTTPDALYPTPNWGTPQFGDAFTTKLGPSGNLAWSTYLGGMNNDGGNSITLDGNNGVYITGYTSSSDFPIVNPILGFKFKRPFQDAFVTMVNPDLASLNFSTYLGGNLDETGTGIAVSNPQSISVSGYTTSYDFPTSVNYPIVPPIKSFWVSNQFQGAYYSGWTDGFIVQMDNRPIPATLVADFTYSVNNFMDSLNVSFTDTSTGSPMTWQWNFGDGTANATVNNPTHTFTTGGSYWVTLTVSNTLPSSDSIRKLVTVIPPPGPKFTNANSTTAIGIIHIAQNGSRKMSLYLNSTPSGLTGYNLTVSFRNTTPPIPYIPNTIITNITDVSRPGWIPQDVTIFQVSDLSLDGYNVTFQGIDLNNPRVNPPGKLDVRLANITLHGNQIGNSTLHINNTWMLTDAAGVNFSMNPPDYNLTVYVEKLQQLPGSIALPPAPSTPKDPNGDGLYEDVNGDGQVNYNDVIDFATYLWWITNNFQPITDNTNEYQPFFDFDQNHVVNFEDVRTLFFRLPLMI